MKKSLGRIDRNSLGKSLPKLSNRRPHTVLLDASGMRVVGEGEWKVKIDGRGRSRKWINKTASCVYLKHLPTGIEIKCQEDRSREHNRFLARRALCEKIEVLIHKEKSKKQMAIEKIRRQKRRRSRRAQEKVLETKKIVGEKKSLRRKVTHDE